MENAGDEPFSAYKSVFQTANGCTRRNADLFGYISHTVPLLSLVGSSDCRRMLAFGDVVDQAGFPNSGKMGAADVSSRRFVATDNSRHGLLDIYTQIAWTFFRRYVRCHFCGSYAVGLPQFAG